LAYQKVTNKLLSVTIGHGLPKESRPGLKKATGGTRGTRGGGGGTPDILRDAGQGLAHRPSRAAPGRPVINNHPSTRMHRPPSQDAPALPSSPTRKAPSRPGAAVVERMHSREFLQTPNPGRAGDARKSIEKPEPGAGRPKPKPRPPPKPTTHPQCRTLFAYDAQDTDELSFNAGEQIDILKEDPSGWWHGRLRNKEGLFPSNYVEKV